MKLKYKLGLSFLAVISLGALLTFTLVHRTTESMFRTFVFSGDAEKAEVYASFLADYYETRGNWTGVQPFIEELPNLVSKMIDTRLHGAREGFPLPSDPSSAFRTLLADRVVIADSEGMIVADTANEILGSIHPAEHTTHGIPVMSHAQKVGTVLVGSMIDSSLTGMAERYLDSITVSLLVSTGFAVAVALLLGFFLTLSITRPLASLARAARGVTAGDSSIDVAVRGHDEISELSASFNEMTAELRRLDAAKKQVIADAAHELRTPVTLIQGMVEGMIDGVFPCDEETLTSVHEETIRLSRLIDTLREIEVIDSGELRLTLETVELSGIVQKAVALFSASALEKSIALTFEQSESVNDGIDVDLVRFGEVIYNLLSNALKYTPEGGSVRVRIEPPQGSAIRFSIDDTGPGIPENERERIFNRFYRIDKSRATKSGGRGLGLAIASEIIKAHGGTIKVETSDLGGSRFVVSIPRAQTATTAT